MKNDNPDDLKPEYIVNGKPALEYDLLKAALQVKNKNIVFDVNGIKYTAQQILDHNKLVKKIRGLNYIVFIISNACALTFSVLLNVNYLIGLSDILLMTIVLVVYFSWRKKIGYRRFLGENR